MAELFGISLAIIVLNFLLFTLCPTALFLEDDIAFYDTIWRNVNGQILGVDYHNPLGFGAFQFAALLWKIIGPYEHVLKLANTILAVPIAWIACVAARRYTALPAPFALLFCIVTAFELTSPGIFGFGLDPGSVGTPGFYNRISTACLSVLFLFAFSPIDKGEELPRSRIAGDIGIAAVLLLYLFLFKISALVIGMIILCTAVLAYRNKAAGIIVAVSSIVLAAVLIALVTFGLGIGIAQLAADYALAGQAKSVPGLLDVYNVLFKDPLNSLNIVLCLFGGYVLRSSSWREWLRVLAIFAVCAGSSFLLNLSNAFETIWLYPPAMAIMTVIACRSFGAHAGGTVDGGASQKNRPTGITIVPLAAFIVVLASQALGTATAAYTSVAIAAGVRSENVVSAGTPIRFRTTCYRDGCSDKILINRGASLLLDAGLSKEKIVTLTHSNPFPVLLLAPPHRGTQVWWNFGYNVPIETTLGWREVLGDATVVMVPQRWDHYPEITERLLDAVRTRLASNFSLIHADKDWKIYRSRNLRPAPANVTPGP